MKHGCKWKCSSWSNNWVKWIIMYKVFYFIQEVSLVRLKVGDGRINLAVLSSINSPEAKALAEQYPQCSNCPAKWRETSTVIVPIHSLSEALICSWAPQNANCRFVDLFTDLNLVLNWDLNEMCVAFKCLLPLSCRKGFLECLWWNSLRQIPPGVSGPKERLEIGCSLAANEVFNDRSVTHHTRHLGRNRFPYTETFCLCSETVCNGLEEESGTRKWSFIKVVLYDAVGMHQKYFILKDLYVQ